MYLCLQKPTKRWCCTSESCWLSGGNFPDSCVINEEAVASFISFCLSVCCPREDNPLTCSPSIINIGVTPEVVSCRQQSLSHIRQPSNSNVSVDESTLRKIQCWVFLIKLSHLASHHRLSGPSRLSWVAPPSSKAGC